jgi:MarR family transcriptional regulator, lower aerobic nicotinate degradation pathway regulator
MTTGDGTQPARLMSASSWLVGQASTYSHRLVTEAFAAAGVRGYHYRLLAALDEFGPASQAALGRSTGIDRSDVVAALNELTAMHLVERSPDPDDRRRNVITLTPAGLDHLKRLDTVLDEIQDAFLAPLSPSERDQFATILKKIVNHHTQRR